MAETAEKDMQSDEVCVDGSMDTTDTEIVDLMSDTETDMQTGEDGIGHADTDEVGLQSDEARVDGRQTTVQADNVDLQSSKAKMDGKDTADADTILCDPCLEEHDEITAVGFCVDCNDFLCKGCVKIHRKQKALKHHILKDKNEMPSSRPNPNKINSIETCPEHKDQKVTLFCKFHEDILCEFCRQVDHRNCENVVLLENIAKEYDISEEMQKIECKLNSLHSEFKKNDEHVKENAVALENYHKAVVRKFNTIRDKDRQLMASIGGTCKLMIEKISKSKNDLNSVRGHNTLAFIELKNAKRCIQDTEARLRSVKSDNKINKYRYTNDSLPTDKPEMLGAILKCPSHLKDIRVDEFGAKKECGITGIEVLPNNRLALADFTNQKIKLIDLRNGKIVSSLDLKETPWGLTKVNDNMIAVSTWKDEKLIFVSCLGDLVVHKTFDKNWIKYCAGLGFSDGKLYMACLNPDQIQVMDCNGVVLNNIKINHKVPINFEDIALYPETSSIYLSDTANNKIHRMNLDGVIQKTYSNKHSKNIHCITMGKEGRLFACLKDPDFIVEMTADLAKCEVIFDHSSGISSPFSIKYNHDDCNLYVGCWNSNTVRVFLV